MSNVRDFGAMGDGVHDDTDAIVHCLNEGDGELQFPKGDYRVSKTIVVDLKEHKHTAIHGTGGLATIFMHGAGPAFELRGYHTASADPNSFKPDVWQHERMPTISQIEIEGRNPEADGVRIIGVMQPTLTGVLIRNVRHGVHMTQRARNVLISHCHIYRNTGIGVYLDRLNLHQTNIIGNHISYCRLGGIRIENSEIRNLQITGNDIEYNNFRTFASPSATPTLAQFAADPETPTAEIYIDCGEAGSVREGTICSNTLQATYSPNGANIRIIGQATAESHKAGMWCISGNLIGSQATNVHFTSVRGITLEGNYIYSGHQRNILLENCKSILIGANCLGHNPDYKDKELCTGIRLVDCQDCTITGLQIQDALAGENTVKDAIPVQRDGLIELVRCQRLNITGMQVLEGSPHALHVEDCSDTVITGCSFLETRKERLTKAAIHWTGKGGGNLVANCRANRPVKVPTHVKLSENLFDA
uniref:Right handed beta helix domain-containing protein n=1 Tax=Schlesneria paludicola TaxID=360056 RepID=A0A7C2K0L9_9PLAN